jgi:hypothetical protein
MAESFFCLREFLQAITEASNPQILFRTGLPFGFGSTSAGGATVAVLGTVPRSLWFRGSEERGQRHSVTERALVTQLGPLEEFPKH